MIPAVCIEMLFGNISAEEKIEKLADEGFSHIEFWSWKDKNIPAIKEVCKKRNVAVANFSGQRLGDLINENTHHVVLEDYSNALNAARLLNVKNLMFLTNELGDEGIVVHPEESKSDYSKQRAVVRGLEKALEMTPDNMNLILEPLNTVLDHQGYYLKDLSTAVEILELVGDPRLQILCDLYHQEMMGDDLIAIIHEYKNQIGYYHIADVPGRHEPGTGAVNWNAVLREIKNSGYEGYVGFEYSPEEDSLASLQRVKDVWKSI